MEQFREVFSQGELDNILNLINECHDSFIREIYVVSNSFLEKDAVVAPDSASALLIFFNLPGFEFEGVEILMKEVMDIRVQLSFDINATGVFEPGAISIRLFKTSSPIVGAQIFYRLIKQVEYGNLLRYGKSLSILE